VPETESSTVQVKIQGDTKTENAVKHECELCKFSASRLKMFHSSMVSRQALHPLICCTCLYPIDHD